MLPLIYYLLMFWKQRVVHKEFNFNCKLDEKARVLVIAPGIPHFFSLSIPAMYSLSHYFKKKPHLFIIEKDFEIFFRYFIKDSVVIENSKERKKILERVNKKGKIDILLDLNYPESPWHKLVFTPDLKIAISDNEPKNFNIVFHPITRNIEQIYSKFLTTFNIPVTSPSLRITKKEKARAWEFAKYHGHKEENLLIFLDLPPKKLENLRPVFNRLNNGKVTLMDNFVTRMLEIKEKLALLSISDLFVSENSIFLWPARIFKVRTYLLRNESNSLIREDKYLKRELKDPLKELTQLIGMIK